MNVKQKLLDLLQRAPLQDPDGLSALEAEELVLSL